MFKRPSRLPKRLRGIALILCLMVLPMGQAGARSQAATTVTISTVPELEGVVFHIRGVRVVSGEDGTVETTVPEPGVYELKATQNGKLGDDVRVAFTSWSDGDEDSLRSLDVTEPTAIEAGFDVDYLIKEHFVDERERTIAPDRLSSVTVSDAAGETYTWPAPSPGVAGPTAVVWERHSAGTRWLRAVDVSLSDEGLIARERSYELEAIVVDGESVSPATRSLPVEPGAEWNLAVAPNAWWSGVWGWTAGLAVILVLLVLARLRPRVSSATKPSQARSRPTPGNRRGQEFVRIALRNGRTVEGWRMTSADTATQAIILDVSAVYSDGQPVPSTPIDSFLLKSQILNYETVEDPPPETRPHAATKRLNPPVSS